MPFLLIAFATGRPKEAILNMNHEHFRSCVDSLIEFRTRLHSDLDPSILAELDDVIRRFEAGLAEPTPSSTFRAKTLDDALIVVARIIEIVAGLSDLMERFTN